MILAFRNVRTPGGVEIHRVFGSRPVPPKMDYHGVDVQTRFVRVFGFRGRSFTEFGRGCGAWLRWCHKFSSLVAHFDMLMLPSYFDAPALPASLFTGRWASLVWRTEDFGPNAVIFQTLASGRQSSSTDSRRTSTCWPGCVGTLSVWCSRILWSCSAKGRPWRMISARRPASSGVLALTTTSA